MRPAVSGGGERGADSRPPTVGWAVRGRPCGRQQDDQMLRGTSQGTTVNAARILTPYRRLKIDPLTA